jgi:hypothetical protein
VAYTQSGLDILVGKLKSQPGFEKFALTEDEILSHFPFSLKGNGHILRTKRRDDEDPAPYITRVPLPKRDESGKKSDEK